MREENNAVAAASSSRKSSNNNKGKNRVPISALIQVASVAAGVQFGWALQLSLLTPYVQELGIPHAWASLIWLCGPISGLFVQPVVGHYSDGCTSKYGRRRPFIVAGATAIVLGILVIGFSADLGFLLGDDSSNSQQMQEKGVAPVPPRRPRAIVVFVLGFWILDLANNVLQGPCRALLADFSGKDQKRTRRANAFYSLFMALGNILGYATGAYAGWWRVFPFTVTTACDVACANLKSAFFLGILVLAFTTFLSVTAASEIPYVPVQRRYSSGKLPAFTPLLADRQADPEAAGKKSKGSLSATEEDGKEEEEEEEKEELEMEREAMLSELLGALRDLPRSMWCILLVTALTWVAWFPFLLFDTDWMGREVYMGEPSSSSSDPVSSKRYYDGVHMGSLGLMLNSLVLGLFSLCIDYVCRKLGSKFVWGSGNLIMVACLVATALITAAAKRTAGTAAETEDPPHSLVTFAALGIFALLGVPLAVTYSVPYSLTATFTEKVGGGQGLSMGVLNLSVVLPQIVVSLGAGSWDELFGGGNLPAFLLGAVAALCGGVAALVILPRPPPDPSTSSNRPVLLLGHNSSPIP